MNQLDERQIGTHVPIVGWLLVASNLLFLLVAALIFVVLMGAGAVSRDPDATAILGITATVVAGLFAALSVPGLIAGFGVLARRNWGRIAAILLAILGLVNFPIGTIIGVYVLWVLMQNSASDYFGQTSTASKASNSPVPMA